MPFRQKTERLSPEQVALVAEIARVISEQSGTSTHPDEPLVIWEENHFTHRIHVTVVWDRWQGIDPESRARVIVEAVERARGADVARTVGMALGVTPEQAERLGVS